MGSLSYWRMLVVWFVISFFLLDSVHSQASPVLSFIQTDRCSSENLISLSRTNVDIVDGVFFVRRNLRGRSVSSPGVGIWIRLRYVSSLDRVNFPLFTHETGNRTGMTWYVSSELSSFPRSKNFLLKKCSSLNHLGRRFYLYLAPSDQTYLQLKSSHPEGRTLAQHGLERKF